ncbi:MAG: AAA family ATPase [Ruminococcus sp.]|nr:AAA family ATPase [Ruminococcus sp.]
MQLISLDEIQSSSTQWLWEPYIPLGKITIIQGDPGEGKTSLMLSLATVLSRGYLPNVEDKKFEPFEVLYLNAEDDYRDTIKPRLEAAKADCTHIHTLFEESEDEPLTLDDDRIANAILGLNAKLLVLDPIQAYLGAKVDMHRANEIRPVMKKLAEIAACTNCAVVLIGHMNKAQGMKSAYRGLGSIDITAAARSVIVVAKDKSNPDIRVVAQIKNSLAPIGETLGFRFCENGVFKSIGTYECDIEDVLLGIGTKNKCTAVEEMLKDELSDGGKPQSELVVKASEMGISVSTLRKAKDKLGVKSEKKGATWYWHLSE